jgi:Tol biopolymer transport system component
VKTITTEGSDLELVTQDLPADWGPFWSPDGRTLFFLSDRGGNPDLWRVAIDDGSGTARGEPEPVTTGVSRMMGGSLSGDGERIAVTVDNTQGEILRSGFDPNAARLTGQMSSLFASSSSMVQPDVSDDGSWIAYRTTSPRENIVVMRSDGTGRRRLTDDEFRNRGPVWMRGADWVVFYSNRDGPYALWLMRADGTELRKLTDRAEDVLQPQVSPDGSRLAFLQSGPTLVLCTARIEEDWFAPGKPPAPIAFDTLATGFLPHGWSPDGTRLNGFAAQPQGVFATGWSRVDRLEWPAKHRRHLGHRVGHGARCSRYTRPVRLTVHG